LCGGFHEPTAEKEGAENTENRDGTVFSVTFVSSLNSVAMASPSPDELSAAAAPDLSRAHL